MATLEVEKKLFDSARYVLAQAGAPSGRVLLTGCSGGPDSMALADVLARLAPELGFELLIASFDHGLRPEAADEVTLVKGLAERLKAGFVSGRAPQNAYGAHPNQDRVRRVRLNWLRNRAVEAGADRLALGHQADDRAETLLMRTVRGAGLRGLASIRPVSVREGLTIIRPLIRVGRADIEAYLSLRGLEPARDPSNRDQHYFRSRIRHEILPLLARENPQIVPGLNRLADLAQDEDEFLDGLAGAKLARLTGPGEAESDTGRISIPAEDLAALHPALARRVIRLAVEKIQGHILRLEAGVVEDILNLAKTGRGRIRLPGGRRAWPRRGRLVIGPAEDGTPALEEISIPGPGRYFLSSGDELVVEMARKPFRPQGPPDRALLDAAAAPFPLRAACRRAGDRMHPLGSPGSRKLSDILIDAKVPAPDRDLVPVIWSGERIIWLAGLTPAHQARITAETKSALEISLIASRT